MNKLYIDNIEFTNFKKHDEFSMNLEGLTLIEGRNGSGKSSIFEAIYVALYNRRPNGKPSKTAVKRGTKLSTITLSFYYNNDYYRLIRTIGSKNSVSLYMNDDLITSSSSKVKEIIESMIPPEVFKLSMLDDIDIKKLLIKYTTNFDHLDKLNKYKDNIQVQLDNQKNLKIELESKISMLSSDIDNLLYQLNEMYSNIQTKQDELSSIEIPEDIDNLITLYNLVNSFDYNSYIDKYIQQQKQELSIIDKEIGMLYEKKKQLQDLYNFEIHKVENDIREKYKDRISLLENNILESNSKISEIDYSIQQLNNHKSKLEYEISNYKHVVEDENRCPLCKQILHKENKENILKEIERLENELREVISRLEDLLQTRTQLQNEVNNMHNELQELDNVIRTEIQSGVNDIQNKFNVELEDVENTLKQLTNKKYLLTEKIKDNINRLDKEKVLLDYLSEHGYSDINIKLINNLPDIISRKELYDRLANELRTLNSQYTTMYKMYEDKVKLKNEIETKLNDVNKQIEELTSKLTMIQNLTNTRLWTKAYLYKLKEVINYYITDEFSNMSVEFDIDDNDNLIIRVTNLNSEDVLYDDLSQGEKVIAKLIIYNAIKKIISNQLEINNLFLDEVIDKLDQENIELVLNYLSNNLNNESVCVITHNSYAKNIDIWSNVIELS